MGKMIYSLIISLTLISCKQETKTIKNNVSTKQKSDTIVIDENTDKIIFIKPTAKYLDSLKSTYKNQDDFYTIADDANFYNAEAGKFIVENNIDTLNVSNNKSIKIGKSVLKLSNYKPWSLLLYQKNKKIENVFPVDIENEFNIYFSKEDGSHKNIDATLSENKFNSSNIINKDEVDFNNDKNKDYIIIAQNNNDEKKTILLFENIKNNYSLIFKNENAIPCEDCGNGAESFYDYKVSSKILSFSSSFKSNENIYKVDFEFNNDFNNFYLLNNVVIFKSEVGNSHEKKIFLNKNIFGRISLKGFNYSEFMSKYVLQ